jgi:hypothetical protein
VFLIVEKSSREGYLEYRSLVEDRDVFPGVSEGTPQKA